MADCRVLVTGGAGFIGSRLVRRLAADGARCWVFDNLHPQVHGPGARAPDLGDRTRLIIGDVGDPTCFTAAVLEAEPHIVYHLAAETGTGQSMTEPTRYSRANVMGTAHLVDAMRQLARPPEALILAGSRAIYGEGEYLTADGRKVTPGTRSAEAMAAGRFTPEVEGEGALVPAATLEQARAAPSSVYASTKLMQEHLVLQAG
ncbi:MAG TPA: NAD-dependent epimerase/dehydratase family protein, partial [Caulobacteraceae bacterium]